MKKNVLLIGFIGVVIGLFIALITYEGVHRTSTDQFCVTCHEMKPMVSAYHNDVHGGNGKVGIKVSCVNCHLPHDNIINYLFTKAKTGIKEIGIHFLGNPNEIDWYEKRKYKVDFVYDKACIHCHTNYKNNETISKKGIQMHIHFERLKGTEKKLSCVSCHNEIGHKGLRNTLNYYKPEYEFYEGKLDKQKDTLEKEIDKKIKKD